jgi:hypothetical protein
MCFQYALVIFKPNYGSKYTSSFFSIALHYISLYTESNYTQEVITMASNTAICLWETNRIASGFALLDQLLKDYPISFVKHYRICPGKAFFILIADTDVVQQIEQILRDTKQIQYKTITGVHPDVLSVFQQKQKIPTVSHLGIYECSTTVAVFHLANHLAWHHQVHLLSLQIGIGLCGKSILTIAGSYSDLKTIEMELSERYPKDIVSFANISEPSTELLTLL